VADNEGYTDERLRVRHPPRGCLRQVRAARLAHWVVSKSLSSPPLLPDPAKEGQEAMAVIVNDHAYEQAQKLIREGKFVADGRDAWSEHQPSTKQENEFIDQHGFDEYEKWFLSIDDEAREGTKARYKYPYGDFQQVHRCGVLSAESRAGQYKHFDVEAAAAHLHGALDVASARGR